MVPVPGPSAVVAALSVSGLPSDRFVFVGFLPPRAGARARALADLAGLRETLVLYESPLRVVATLTDMLAVLGDREVFLCREATKLHEEYVRGTTSAVLALLAARPEVKGEIVLVVSGAGEAPPASRGRGGRHLRGAGRRRPHAARGGEGDGAPPLAPRPRGLCAGAEGRGLKRPAHRNGKSRSGKISAGSTFREGSSTGFIRSRRS